MTLTASTWLRVSRRHPCPVCQRGDWCLVTDDGTAAICMRVESPKEVDCGGAGRGWLHKLDGQAIQPPPRRERYMPPANVDWAAMIDRLTAATMDGDLCRLSAALGVTPLSLRRLRCCWHPQSHAWAFPMYSPDGEIVGVRLRAEDGAKWCIKGSRQGLFIPDGQLPDQASQVLICEGPTDTAAMLDLDFVAVGRPTCSGMEAQILGLLAGRHMVIVADVDAPKQRPDGATWRPGQEGAARLAAAAFGKVKSVKLVYPLTGKDARAWKQSGATSDVVAAVIRNAGYWRSQ